MTNENAGTSERHSALATALLDEAARLRERGREIMRTSPPPVPGVDHTEAFAKL